MASSIPTEYEGFLKRDISPTDGILANVSSSGQSGAGNNVNGRLHYTPTQIFVTFIVLNRTAFVKGCLITLRVILSAYLKSRQQDGIMIRAYPYGEIKGLI